MYIKKKFGYFGLLGSAYFFTALLVRVRVLFFLIIFLFLVVFELEVVVVVVVVAVVLVVVVDKEDVDDELVVVVDDVFEVEEVVDVDDDEVINLGFRAGGFGFELFTISLSLVVLFTQLERRIILRVTTRLTLFKEADLLNCCFASVVFVPLLLLLLLPLSSKPRNEAKEFTRSVSVAVAESPALLSLFFFLRIIFIILRGRPVD